MTLIEDILAVAQYVRDLAVDPVPDADPGDIGDSADRILSAHDNGGLAAAVLRQAAGRLESRLVELLRREVQAIVSGEEKDV